jgi:hypothetical protein
MIVDDVIGESLSVKAWRCFLALLVCKENTIHILLSSTFSIAVIEFNIEGNWKEVAKHFVFLRSFAWDTSGACRMNVFQKIGV